MKVKLNDPVLLLGKDETYIVKSSKEKFNVKSGIIDLKKIIGKSYGSKIKTHLGKEFVIAKPTLLDLFSKMKRTAQVILPKDASMIIGYTGISTDSSVVDAGTGTGYLSIFLAHYLSDGKVVTYEKDRRFVENAKENIKLAGLTNLKLKNKDIYKGIDEKNVDLITLDLQNPEKVIRKSQKPLNVGGWIVVYSPTMEHVMKIIKILRKEKFSEIKTVENIVREWQTERTTRPKTMGLMHTGWLTFARKV